MAKVQVNYDTETKELDLMIDGVKQPDIITAEFVKYEDDYAYFSASYKPQEQNGVIYSMRSSGSKIEKVDSMREFIKENLTKNRK